MAEKTLQEQVADSLASVSEPVRAAVVSTIVAREVEKKSKILVQALDLLSTAEKDFKKIDRPDVEIFDEEEKAAATYFSKTRVEERRKQRERINKIKGAIEKALTKGDYGDINNLANSKPQQSSGDNPDGAA